MRCLLLLSLLFCTTLAAVAWAASVPCPTVLVVIACRGAEQPNNDPNAAYTNQRDFVWDAKDGLLHCRRFEVEMTDPSENMGASPLQPNWSDWSQCGRAAMQFGTSWDIAHQGTPYRVWRIACPTPMINSETGDIVGWKLPDCGHWGQIVCDIDTEI